VPQRTAGKPLQDSEREGTGVPQGGSCQRHAARWGVDPGGYSDGLFLCNAHVAGAARQVDFGKDPERSAPDSAGGCAKSGRIEDWLGRLPAPAIGGASSERDVCFLSRANGPVRIRAGKL